MTSPAALKAWETRKRLKEMEKTQKKMILWLVRWMREHDRRLNHIEGELKSLRRERR